MKPDNVVRSTKGRPRSFDCEKALYQAMRVFWEKGYEGASLEDLTQAMGINRPSLYAAFGDKEALFRKVLDRYEAEAAGYFGEAMRQSTARAVVEQLLFGSADGATNPCTPRGCLMVQGALASGDSASAIQKELAVRRSKGESLLRKRLKRAQWEGDLPIDANAADLARYVIAVIRGMAVEAAGGATRAQLRRVAETAMRAWPD
jgi:AcrR family transcriptional regulator